MRNVRPYERESVANLEQIFKSHNFNKKVLRTLDAELKRRSTKNAKLLRGKVQAQIVDIRKREQFWHDKEAKDKAARKAASAKAPEQNSSKIPSSPSIPAGPQQASLLDAQPATKIATPAPAILTPYMQSQAAASATPDPVSQMPSSQKTLIESPVFLEAQPKPKAKRIWYTIAALVLIVCVGYFFALKVGSLQTDSATATNHNKAQAAIADKMIVADAKRKLAGEPVNYQSGPYSSLRMAGFSDAEIRGFIRPILLKAGFKREEVAVYFKSYDHLYALEKDPDAIVKNHWNMIENLLH